MPDTIYCDNWCSLNLVIETLIVLNLTYIWATAAAILSVVSSATNELTRIYSKNTYKNFILKNQWTTSNVLIAILKWKIISWNSTWNMNAMKNRSNVPFAGCSTNPQKPSNTIISALTGLKNAIFAKNLSWWVVLNNIKTFASHNCQSPR